MKLLRLSNVLCDEYGENIAASDFQSAHLSIQ